MRHILPKNRYAFYAGGIFLPHAEVNITYGLLIFAIIAGIHSSPVYARPTFNPAFLAEDPTAVANLNHFLNGATLSPGQYRVDIFLNQNYISTEDVTFSARAVHISGEEPLIPQFTASRLDALGINLKALNRSEAFAGTDIVPLTAVLPYSRFTFDAGKQRLDISIPQAAMKPGARGYIPPERWEEGINAMTFNYNFIAANSRGDTKAGNYYLNLQAGANMGAWRVRDYSTYRYDRDGFRQDHVSTYAQRAIIPFRSALTLGDSYTSGELFDPTGFRGMQLASDDGMVPDSQRGFAPVIRGIAKSNARIDVKQNGYVIYQTYVAPGAFAITDLYPTSSSGDLQVVVTEADGSISRFNVPYSSLPTFQREGRTRYALTAGRFRGYNGQSSPAFSQLSVARGMALTSTLYGGMQLADHYRSLALGAGKNLGEIGAISADITHARSELADGSRHDGQSLRFLYAKSLSELGTNFQLLGYRYSTQGFYSLSDTANRLMAGSYFTETQDGPVRIKPDYRNDFNLYYTRKGKIQMNISQQTGTSGAVFFTGSYQNYWHARGTDRLLQAGYNGSLGNVNYNLSYSFNRGLWSGSSDQIVAMNFSVPLSRWLAGNGRGTSLDSTVRNNAYATYGNSTDNQGRMNHYAGISGTALDGSNLNYTIQQGYGNRAEGMNGNASLNYQGIYANASAAYSYTRNARQTTYGLAGGVMLHGDGLTFSQPLGESNVLVRAPGAAGVAVANATGVKTDWRGYAVVPWASSYRENRIVLDTRTLGDEVDITDAVVSVVPTRGAIAQATFDARTGGRVLMDITHQGRVVPFGAMVYQDEVQGGSIVGDLGRVYLTGMKKRGALTVRWGESSTQICQVRYDIPERLSGPFIRLRGICQ